VKPAYVRSATIDLTITGTFGTNVRPLRSNICATLNLSASENK
jgi:hypothetical protein